MENVVGTNGVGIVLRFAKLGHLIGNSLPDSLGSAFPFEYPAAINQAIEDVYGDRAAKGSCMRAGRATLNYGVKESELVPGLFDLDLQCLPSGRGSGQGGDHG